MPLLLHSATHQEHWQRSRLVTYYIIVRRRLGANYANFGGFVNMISGAQIRAARALLGISAAELAEISGIGHRTLQRFEAVDGIPDARTALLRQLASVLESKGIVFQGDPIRSPGVQLRRSLDGSAT
jgi:Helix-turn-helix